MAASAIDKELLEYVVQLNESQKKPLLNFIKSFLKNSQKPGQRVSLEQYNQELEEAEREIENGHFVTQEELEREMKNW